MTMPLVASDFAGFFEAANGVSPFPWQSRLAGQVLEGSWPDVLALPTAAGKTACLDIAVFALACCADGIRPPRRIFFVVDRRVIVDEAFERARRLADRLRRADSGILKSVADRLRQLAGGDDPLICFQLRGGIYRDDAWARSPIQPTIIASTVDQIGSRLLYRGYGLRSGSAWPIHAGLAANDSLILLDEAHCSNPFRQTATAIARYRTWGDQAIRSPFRMVLMSATPPVDCPASSILRLGQEDVSHPVLRRRLQASKPARLVVADKAKGGGAIHELARVLAKQATAQPGVKAICILVNRVAAARAVQAMLEEAGEDAVLLTGRMRPLDRDQLMGGWMPRGSDPQGPRGLLTWFGARADKPELPHRVFVVATQCLEVGANLDFEAMVSECASLDALRQRFGRLNRLGHHAHSPGVIVIRGDQVEPKEEDPIYGSALPRTWQWLGRHARAGVVDMGINAVQAALNSDLAADPDLLANLCPPAPDAPVMLPAHVDCWVQTSPIPCPDPDVSIFLHGPRRGAADVQVCWRADVDEADPDEQKWIEAAALCPPASAECMPVPLMMVRRWLTGDMEDRDSGDAPAAEQEATEGEVSAHMVLRWLGPDASELVTDPVAIRPGDTLILAANAAGSDSFGCLPGHVVGQAVNDLGEEANLRARAKAVLRVHPAVMASWPGGAARQRLLELATDSASIDNIDAIRESLADLAQVAGLPPWLTAAARSLAQDRRLAIHHHPFCGLVLRGSRLVRGWTAESASFTDEDQTSSATVSVPLHQHLQGVADRAKTFAEACGLSQPLAEDIALAARCHDLGKADPRFQAFLRGGTGLPGLLLAKSQDAPRTPQALVVARQRSGYPVGGRHELLSVRMLEAAGLLSRAADPDLVLHLIACHHGRCRPFAPVVEDPSPVTASLMLDGCTIQAGSSTGLERLDSGVSERFWRLVRRYGWWGVAYLEAIVRLADHRCSEAEQSGQEAEA